MAPDFFRPLRTVIFFGWMATSAAGGLSQEVSVDEQTLANGLRMVHLESDAFEGAALAMQWTFKPGLELDKTGTREAWAQCLDAQWKADTVGTGWDLTWQITPFGFLAHGNAEDWADWSTALLQGIFEGTPASQWESVRTQWISDWDTIEHEPNRLRQRATAHAIFSSRHIYGEATTTESLQAISAEDIASFRKAYWLPSNCTLAIAAPPNTPRPALMTEVLTNWEKREVQKAALPVPSRPRQLSAAIVLNESEPLFGSAAFSIRLKPTHPDALATRLLVRHLESTTNANLLLHLDPLASSLVSNWNGGTKDFKTNVEELRQAMRDASREALTDSVLNALRSAAETDYTHAMARPDGALGLLMTEPSVFAAAAKGDLHNVLGAIRANDVQRVGINYLRPDQMHVILVGPAEDAASLMSDWIDSESVAFFDQNLQPLSAYGPAPAGMTASEVFAAHYEAIGGVAALEGLKSCRQMGTMSAGGGMVMDVESESSYGVGHRTTISVEGQIMMEQLVRPNEGISKQMGKRRAMTEAEYQRYEEGMYAMPLLAAELRGLEVELVGSSNASGSTQYVIETYRQGDLVASYFFDSESHLLVRRVEVRKGPTGPVTIKTSYEDYRAFEGFSFPTRIVQRSNNQNMEFSIETVQPGARVDKKQFEWE